MALRNNFVYTAINGEGIGIAYIDSNENLIESHILYGYENVKELAVYENYLLAASDADGIIVFDISTASNLVFSHSFLKNTNNGALSILVKDHYLIVAESYYQFWTSPVLLSVWDISQINSPVLLSETLITTQN